MTQQGQSFNFPRKRATLALPSGRLILTPDEQRLLVAEAMAQVRPEGERAMTGVLGGIEAYTSASQRAWYAQELERALLAAQAPATPATPEALAALSLAERRALAAAYGVTTPSGRPSSSVALIWAAVRAAQVAEAQVPAPALVLDNPVTGSVYLPYHVGPFEQVQQRHFTQLAVPASFFPIPLSEEENDAALELAAARRLELHIGEVQARERGDVEECERLYRLQGVETRHMLALTAALGQGGPHEQVQQRHYAGVVVAAYPEAECEKCGALLNALGSCPVCGRAPQQLTQVPAVMVPCEACEGTGQAWYDVGREADGTPIEACDTCEVCHGDREVPVKCPECKREGVALVVSDWDAGHQWCLHCALDAMENGDGYTAAQVAEIQAQAVAAGILTLPEQHAQVEQQQGQRLVPEDYVAMLAEYRFTRQDGALITQEQRAQLDGALFELIGDFALTHRLNVQGQALFEWPDSPRHPGHL